MWNLAWGHFQRSQRCRTQNTEGAITASQPDDWETTNQVHLLSPSTELRRSWSRLVLCCTLSFSLICFPWPRRQGGVKTDVSAATVSLWSGTSCMDWGFTRRATTISRKINYDVTQSRPEGKLPDSTLHPSTCWWLKNKNSATEQKRVGRRSRSRSDEGKWVYFEVQLHRWLKYSDGFKQLAEVEVPQESRLFEIQTTGTCAGLHMRTL